MANTFLLKQGLPVGDSVYEENVNLQNLMARLDKQIILPKDFVIYERKILDIGPATIKYFEKIIKGARTIIWNGPLGWIEKEKFAGGTKMIGQAVFKNKQAKIVIGGGETVASLPFKTKNQNPRPGVFLSTGGGAMMEYLAGKKLPGIEALN
jgi:phosphoglycerate kinase